MIGNEKKGSAVSSATEWEIPADLTLEGQDAARVIREFLVEKKMTDAGGGGRFYSPQEWEDRGESYGRGSVLIVTHDGGDHAPAFNWDYEAYGLMEELRQRLLKVGAYAEQCTSWYSAIHLTEDVK